MNGPGANALDHGEHGEEGLVIHGYNGSVGKDAAVVLSGEVVEVGSLAGGDTDLAQLKRGEGKDSLRDNAFLTATEG